MDAVFSKGGKVLSEDGKQVLIDSPEWVDTWEQFRKWIHEDKIMRIHSGGQGWEYWYKTIDDVMKGQAAGYTGSSGDRVIWTLRFLVRWSSRAGKVKAKANRLQKHHGRYSRESKQGTTGSGI